ncbi:MAG: putative 4-hydroxybenzoate polyprenyltransferase [Desulfovibrio sp.]|nr:putative 4-hydroxybenzoate polyprenyltransferase [Desulfovibrio sp.]
MNSFWRIFANYCNMIKIEHSIFALPYAWAGCCLATKGLPSLYTFFWLTLAMVGIRSFAMGINRIVDLPYDMANTRTQNRALVTGLITIQQTMLFCVIMAILFIFSCSMLNDLCFWLSIPALFICGIYSYLKRITPLCHFWLGGTLGLAPIAGWLSVQPNTLPLVPILLFFAVLFWVAAFDIYYSFQDIEFDRTYGLNSVPANYGSQTALAIAGFSHTMTVIFLFLMGFEAGLSSWWYIITGMIAVLLLTEHSIMRPNDLRQIDTAFFTLNGIISPAMLVGVLLGLFY